MVCFYIVNDLENVLEKCEIVFYADDILNMNNNLTFKITTDVIIEKVNKIKYLGFLIDKDLNFKEHLEYTYI